ncbi:hypothetical protein AURDEDRAFT_144637 [Auricularia subglabra TFB-10046 SS5]|nr:hypothetical protein AURDEDRAFT_144637 [Auricularia subglabra TFB-10046 SS5]
MKPRQLDWTHSLLLRLARGRPAERILRLRAMPRGTASCTSSFRAARSDWHVGNPSITQTCSSARKPHSCSPVEDLRPAFKGRSRCGYRASSSRTLRCSTARITRSKRWPRKSFAIRHWRFAAGAVTTRRAVTRARWMSPSSVCPTGRARSSCARCTASESTSGPPSKSPLSCVGTTSSSCLANITSVISSCARSRSRFKINTGTRILLCKQK